MTNSEKISEAWWKETIVYQIYPRSFQDSNGDGIGDLRGIINRLDYISDLGVETLWLNPIFASPNDDNGYDISDYRKIMDEFGSMADFEELVEQCKNRNLRIILDLVLNHSSDEHYWFKEAQKSPESPYRDYYYWRKPNPDGTPPNNWVSYFAPSTWAYDENSNEYYLHIFSPKQPDLNWENPKVRQEIYDIIHYWMEKGVDGFRLDAFILISKHPDLLDIDEESLKHEASRFFGNGPRLHEFLHEMNREVISKYDMMTVGEGAGITAEEASLFVGENRKELHMIYHFDHMSLDRESGQFFKPKKFDLRDFKKIISDWDKCVLEGGWNAVFLGNHDFPRMLSRFGNDGIYRKESAKLLGMLLLTQRGTPFMFSGDEIGMTNVPWETLDKYRDIHVFDGYEKYIKGGGEGKEFLQNLKHTARDNARTPMQWDLSEYAGFSINEPWIDVNPNFEKINVEESLKDPHSILNFYKTLINIRKNNPSLIYGEYDDLFPDHPTLFVYARSRKEEVYLIILNFDDKGRHINLGPRIAKAKKCILSNYENPPILLEEKWWVRPWEAGLFYSTSL